MEAMGAGASVTSPLFLGAYHAGDTSGIGPSSAVRELPTRRSASGRPAPSANAFTLIEVILALVIAVGILTVVLYFYQQSASLRAQLIAESERISAVRLLMDRLTTELRGASARLSSQTAFSGTPTSLRFVTTTLPAPSAPPGVVSPARLSPDTGFKLVSYSLGRVAEGTNVVVSGLVRTEQSTVERRAPSTVPQTNAAPAEAAARPVKADAGSLPVTDAVRYLRCRYFDGQSWLESWTEPYLPKAVEVCLGGEPMPPDAENEEEYPFDLFRRVIYLPGSESSVDVEALAFGTEEAP
jgi:type II secretory pathway pseudopilin PulG